MPNALQHESSPYLLQHANNPVDWLPWNEETLQRAKDENKPMLISIGYSACHWCHVMEHESFEDEDVAKLMNEHFICIKVDREERPDVDQVYMDAVQLMTGQGGWPLNCFTLPNGRPFFGGTYFDKVRWKQTLINIYDAFKGRRQEVEEYATKLIEGLQEMDEMPIREAPEAFTDEAIEAAVSRWKKRFDNTYGGFGSAPKFPMPNNLSFLLHYATAEDDQEVREHVKLTLHQMAKGGIYDQIGGGFCRYSVDQTWKVPHFEKMLYDNGQLLSLYAESYLHFEEHTYLDTAQQTAEFLLRELWNAEGYFYSALDADSEGEEGKFYVWTKEEFDEVAGADHALLRDYFSIDKDAHWEDGKNIPLRSKRIDSMAKQYEIDTNELMEKVKSFRAVALQVRNKRIRPGLDDKCLTSWNAMTAKGLLDVYLATENERYLATALQNLRFIQIHIKRPDHALKHTYKKGNAKVSGYLEDYAHYADALIRAYELTFDEEYVNEALSITEYVLDNFDQNANSMFYFKSKNDAALIAQKAEINDNVIPASNSVFSCVLFKLGLLFGRTEFHGHIKIQLSSLESLFSRYPSGYSQWMRLMLWMAEPYFEICIIGQDCEQKRTRLLQQYLPNALICGGKNEGTLPILQGRKKANETLFYVCQNGACQLPVSRLEEALEQML